MGILKFILLLKLHHCRLFISIHFFPTPLPVTPLSQVVLTTVEFPTGDSISIHFH